MKNSLFIKIYLFTSLIFAPITFLSNLLIGILVDQTSFLTLGGMFIILIFSFIISAFVVILKENPPKIIDKCKVLSYSVGFYTAISVILNVFVQILMVSINSAPNKLWNVFSAVLTLAFSIAISLLMLYFKPKSISLLLTAYFFVVGIFYYLLTITFGGLGTDNKIIIVLSIYVVAFALVSTIILLIKFKKAKKERDSKPYQKQF